MFLHLTSEELGQMTGLASETWVSSALCQLGAAIHPCFSSTFLCLCDLPWKVRAPGSHGPCILGYRMRRAEEA